MNNEEWREELQSEIMEHYLFLAELKPHAKDKTAHMIEMREQWEKLNNFISTILAEERNKVIEKLDAMAFENDDGYKVELFINWDKAKAELNHE